MGVCRNHAESNEKWAIKRTLVCLGESGTGEIITVHAQDL